MHSPTLPYRNVPCRNTWNKIFYADATRRSVLWHSAPFPFRGEFLYNYAHIHARWLDGLWALSGPPESLGLNTPPLVLRKPWEPLVPVELGMTVAELQRTLLRNLQVDRKPPSVGPTGCVLGVCLGGICACACVRGGASRTH